MNSSSAVLLDVGEHEGATFSTPRVYFALSYVPGVQKLSELCYYRDPLINSEASKDLMKGPIAIEPCIPGGNRPIEWSHLSSSFFFGLH